MEKLNMHWDLNPKGLRQQKRKNKLAKLPLLDASLVKKNQLEDKNEEKLILSEATCPQDELKSNKNLNFSIQKRSKRCNAWITNRDYTNQNQAWNFARHKNGLMLVSIASRKKNPTKVFFPKIEVN